MLRRDGEHHRTQRLLCARAFDARYAYPHAFGFDLDNFSDFALAHLRSALFLEVGPELDEVARTYLPEVDFPLTGVLVAIPDTHRPTRRARRRPPEGSRWLGSRPHS